MQSICVCSKCSDAPKNDKGVSNCFEDLEKKEVGHEQLQNVQTYSRRGLGGVKWPLQSKYRVEKHRNVTEQAASEGGDSTEHSLGTQAPKSQNNALHF